MGLLHAAGSDELTFHAAPERAKAHIGNSPETADEKKKKFAWMPLRDYLLSQICFATYHWRNTFYFMWN